jgi:predicted nucleic acid-binding Zn ribbon protein
MNKCLSCGQNTKNKEFCSGKCRKMFNQSHYENQGLKRSFKGLRA